MTIVVKFIIIFCYSFSNLILCLFAVQNQNRQSNIFNKTFHKWIRSRLTE